MNPYRTTNIYGPDEIAKYKGKFFFHVQLILNCLALIANERGWCESLKECERAQLVALEGDYGLNIGYIVQGYGPYQSFILIADILVYPMIH